MSTRFSWKILNSHLTLLVRHISYHHVCVFPSSSYPVFSFPKLAWTGQSFRHFPFCPDFYSADNAKLLCFTECLQFLAYLYFHIKYGSSIIAETTFLNTRKTSHLHWSSISSQLPSVVQLFGAHYHKFDPVQNDPRNCRIRTLMAPDPDESRPWQLWNLTTPYPGDSRTW